MWAQNMPTARESLKHRYHQVGKRQKLPLISLANPPMVSGASTTNGTNGLIWLTDNFTYLRGRRLQKVAQKGRTFLIIQPQIDVLFPRLGSELIGKGNKPIKPRYFSPYVQFIKFIFQYMGIMAVVASIKSYLKSYLNTKYRGGELLGLCTAVVFNYFLQGKLRFRRKVAKTQGLNNQKI